MADISEHFAGNHASFYKHYIPDLRRAGKEFQGRCLFHDDKTPSLSVNNESGLFHCFGCEAKGDAISFYAKLKNLDAKRDFQKIITGICQDFGIDNGGKEKSEPEAVYPYCDAEGNLLYEICRMPGKDGKEFRARRPDGKGGYIWNLQGIEPCLYNLPAVIASDEVLIVEGEKDVDTARSLGLVGTCNSFGAGKWRDTYPEYLREKNIIVIADNDEAGIKHAEDVAQSLCGKAKSIKIIRFSAMPKGADLSDFVNQYTDPTETTERLSIMIEGTPLYESPENASTNAVLPPLVNADDWLQTDPPEPDQILADVFDRGDKVVLIGSSKSKKTFFLLQLLIAIATGKSFLGLHIPKPRRILHIQFEIQAHHFHRRLRRMCRAMGISDLGGRLFILNARGLGMSGAAGIEKIRLYAEEVRPDVISLDPLYKVLTGDENSNSNDGLKGLLDAFDGLAETTGAAIMYAHHDPKGTPGDRATTDRGAGGGVLGRDFDASIVMTSHATEEDAYVIETSLRNYRPMEPFTALWSEDESTGGYCFEARLDIIAMKKTSKTSKQVPGFDTYLPTAAAILGDGEIKAKEFREEFKAKSGIGDKRIRGFLAFATAGGYPYILERIDTKANNVKWIRMGRQIE